jgi:hypothetical protein
MKSLRISDTLNLPVDAATQTFAFIARKGGGKTYAAGKLVEELMTAGVQVVILDTVGNWYGLRLGADGKSAGFDIPIFGGLRGDVPLEATGGALIAEIAVETGRSMVLDCSQFSLADRKRFAVTFGEKLWQRKKADSHPSPLHLVIEESQLIVPQQVTGGGDTARMVGIYEEIIRLGRNYGIGVSMISQRPQSVNKEVLNQTECLFVGQVNGAQERDALKKWIVHQGMDTTLVNELPSLKIGTFYVWSPQWLQILQKVAIAPKKTLDASATPKVGESRARRELKPLDLDDLKTKMAATIERAKAEDPRELRKKITELERQAKSVRPASAPAAAPNDRETKRAARAEWEPLLKERDARIRDLEGRLSLIAKAIGKAHAANEEIAGAVGKELSPLSVIPASAIEPSKAASTLTPRREMPVMTRAAAARRAAAGADGELGKCERAILTVLDQYEGGCNSGKLTLLSGYRFSGGFKNSLSTLRVAGLIEGGNMEIMRITPAGHSLIGGTYEPLPRDPGELQERWLADPKLGKCEVAILSALFQHPRGLTSERLCEITNYQYSGGFKNSLSTLRTAGLLIGRNTEVMRASEEFFS